ncbi:metallophosphoesterase family protein [Paenibacillus xylanilyticus]|uniref:Metallophosphoesterase n=1 Tax=Paenibacillus xylanilyticus TaxID=248903 RepID=A0A7Y6BUY1_9BACL|nr:metallophosphoesterase family protein [Paenibacillus xylanilyticus]NUU74615.1 metallophosphoesterase [Paenibacillus xylanilyticus]
MLLDIHGTISANKRFNSKNFPQQKQLTKDDYLIITGDFGLIWDGSKENQYWLKWLDKTKPFTTLFIDGNHENFDLLEEYPVEIWNGGKVHRINDSVIHLMRGQVFESEMPSQEEYEEELKNLEEHDWKILTHACSTIY